MKINATVTSLPGGATSSKGTGPTPGNDTAAQTGGNTDSASKVTLSETAQLISSPGIASITHPESDLERIIGIKQEISAGTFRTDPARIAEKFHQLNMSLQ